MKRACLTLGIICVSLPAGCGDVDDGIREYTVPKEQAPGDAGHEVKPRKQRLLGAIIPEGKKMWFFKLKGPIGDVNAVITKQFLGFIETVRFKDGKPAWSVPKPWRQLPDNDRRNQPASRFSFPRFATLLVDPDNEKLELTITSLENPGNVDETEFILLNVNRWRGQVGLPHRTKDNLYDPETVESNRKNTDEVRKLTIGGRTAVLAQFVGFPPPPRPGRGPFMRP
ncbi:MAG: hypothetical protein ACE5KM_05880 [Planctomycetaceae bacterium]